MRAPYFGVASGSLPVPEEVLEALPPETPPSEWSYSPWIGEGQPQAKEWAERPARKRRARRAARGAQ